MKFIIPFFAVLLCCNLEFVLLDDTENDDDALVDGLEENTSAVFPKPVTTAFELTTPPQNDYLQNISIQDVISSDIDASEKIEKKIIQLVKQYASNCTYRKVDLSIKGFTFPQNSIIVDLGSAKATFHDIRINETTQNSSKRKLYSTSIACDSAKMNKVEIQLPKDLEITANISVTQSTNSPNGSSSVLPEILNTGSISLILTHNLILKLFSTRLNDADNITSKIFYSKSAVSLNIDLEFQMSIYNKLQTFLDEVESPIKQFLIKKLNLEFDCSKFTNADTNSKKINLPFFDSKLNHLYVIPNAKLEMWKGVSLSAGPILIGGLSSFNNTEFITSEHEVSSPDGEGFYYRTTPRYDDPEMKEITVKIKTNNLKGKVDWSYNSEQRSISFILEFIQFEVKQSNTYEYQRKSETYAYDESGREHYYPYNSYARTNKKKINLNVHMGNIQIDSSKSSICENENKFVNFVLSEYLKTIITDSLKNSLDKKIQDESLFLNCNLV